MAIIKVKTGGITADAITSTEIADNAVVTAAINADAVTDAKIADDVVGTEHLTANEVDTAALKADAVTGAQLADDAVNSEHYTDGSVDTAHIADAQITTAKLSTAVFTGATDIGAAIVDADLFLMDDGAGGTIRKTTASRIKTYAGSANTPAFSATINSQTLSANTATLIEFDTMLLTEPSSTYNTSTYKFTPGVAGTYLVSATIAGTSGSSHAFAVWIKKNGSTNYYLWEPTTFAGYTLSGSRAITLDDNDYIQLYANVGMANKNIGSINSQWSAFRIIE